DSNGVSFRTRLIANFNRSARLGSIAPGLYNFFMTAPGISSLVKRVSGFASKRSMPAMYKTTLRKWFVKNQNSQFKSQNPPVGKVYLFCDEFTNYNDTEIGIKTIQLLEKLGYEVIIPEHEESGRAWLSKGLLRKAKVIANKNLALFHPIITDESP